MNPTLNREIRQVLYQLKQLYGNSIDIYKVGDETVDYDTGVATVPKTVIPIKRAIVMPVKIAQKALQTISVISANKEFVRGGTWLEGMRIFVIDRLDAPTLSLQETDYIVYRSKKYEIKSLELYEYDTAWVIIGIQIESDSFDQIHLRNADNYLGLSQQVTVVLA